MMTKRTVRFLDALTIEMPSSWREDNVAIFSNGGTGEDAVSVVLRREMVDPRTSLSAFADLQLVQLAKSLPVFTLTARRELTVSGVPALQLTFTWVAQGISFLQTHTMLRDSPLTAICIISSSSSRKAQEWEGEFIKILQSIAVTIKGNPAPGR